MKPIAPFLFLLTMALQAIGQNVFIPDPNFRSFLQSNYPSCMNGDSLDSQCPEVVNEEGLQMVNLGIEDLTGIEAFSNLIGLMCTNGQLSFLPELPSSLENLTVFHQALAELPNLPEGLRHLDVGNNQLTSLPTLPDSLRLLDCGGNDLSDLPPLPGLLEVFACYQTQITSVPELPNSLIQFFCNSNDIDSLPVLPNGITDIQCQDNNLVNLPNLPDSLEYIYCFQNNLVALPPLPDGIDNINCSYNNIGQLPDLPDSLYRFNCAANELTVLPDLPDNLRFLICSSNQISVLPELPEGLHELSCIYNDLHCLPILPTSIYELNFDVGNNITCIPNEPSNPNLQGLWPICTSNNISGCNFLTLVSGRVYDDENANCLDDAENGLRDRLVGSTSGAYAISDSTGAFELFLDTGYHLVSQVFSNEVWTNSCPDSVYQLNLSLLGSDTVTGIDFSNSVAQACHWLHVDVATPAQRPCFNTNFYTVSYCNYGSIAATNAYVELTLPEIVIPLSSTIPWQFMGDNVYQFPVGDLDVDECGSFTLFDSVSWEGIIGSTICLKAEIFPEPNCALTIGNWDQSSISVYGTCGGNSVGFEIKNEGVGDMSQQGIYRIFKDNLLYQDNETFNPLLAGMSTTVSIPFDGAGHTYRLEADQSEGHPGISLPRANVELCGSPEFSLGQILTSQQNDLDDHIEIDCTVLSAAYDPNDKQVIPSGVGPQHFVHPDNELLEYKIRFQNTGNDTAFNIEVVDTLPAAFVSVETFQSGSSSDPYTVTMHGNGIVTWHFNDILLPDSNVNEPESHGFVKFKIQQKPNLPNGTVINNSAAIYFDYNAPIITNTSFITISDTVLWAEGVGIEERTQLNVSVQPNPFSEMCLVRLEESIANGRFQVFDPMGRLVHAETFNGNQFQLGASALENGIYTVRILDRGAVRGNTRVSVLR